MKEILFRGKRLDNNEWVYGGYMKNKNGIYITDTEHYHLNASYKNYLVIPETIGQYTGLEDKNGKKIFDGDKVMYDYEWTKPNEVGVITWNESNASFQIKGHIPSSSMKHLDRMKVIGNIFDEKEND